MIEVYRADDRHLQTIRQHGFSPKNPRDLKKVKEELLTYCKPGKNLNDISELIKRSGQNEYVSTAITEDCGGYSSYRIIYKIRFNDLAERPWTSEVLGDGVEVKKMRINPKLLLNTEKLEQATVIALKLFGNTQEVTFLTPIAPGEYYKLQTTGSGFIY